MDPNDLLLIGQADPLRSVLEKKGYRVEAVGDGTVGVELATSDAYAVVLITAPGARELLRSIRERSMVPVLVVVPAENGHEGCIACLETGADDCMLQPLDTRELLARIRSVQRRAGRTWPEGEEPTGELLGVDDLALDTAARRASRGGQAIPLTGVEFSLLETLVRAAGHPISREALTRQVLRRSFSPFDRSIDVHVSNLRRKLGPGANGQERIRTVRGVGYLYVVGG